MTGVDLLPGPWRERRARATRMRAWGLAACATVVAVAGAAGLHHAGLLGAARAAEHGLANLRARHEDAGRRLAVQRDLVEDARRTLNMSRALDRHPDWSVLLRAVAATRGDSIAIESASVKPRLEEVLETRRSRRRAEAQQPREPRLLGYDVAVQGLAPDAGEISALAQRLERTGLFDGVRIAHWGPVSDDAARGLRFRIDGWLQEPGRAAASAGGTP